MFKKYIKPKIKINTVELGGVEITYATGFNAKFISDNLIGPGAIVKIVRSGDVIPKIEQVLKSSDTTKPKMPTNIRWKWNDTGVDIIATDLDQSTMNKIIVKKLTYFFTTLDIKWMAESTIEKFVSNGYDDLWKILQADRKQIEKIDGLGKTLVEKLYQSIENGLKSRKLAEIMGASQIFGRGIGVRKFKLITDAHPNILDIFKEKGSEHVVGLINNIMGFDTKTTTKIVDNMEEFIKYLEKILKLKPNLLVMNTNESKEKINKSQLNKSNTNTDANTDTDANTKYNFDKFTGKTVVFTGFRDKYVEEELEKINTKISTTISKNTNFLIAANPEENSNKINKAKELKIEIISKEQFYNLIKK